MMYDPLFDDSELHTSLFAAQLDNANYGSGSSTDTPQNSKNYPTLSEQVNDILSVFPGFSGICLAIDKANQFPGVRWFSPNTVIHLPRTGDSTINNVEGVIEGAATLIFAPQDYIGAAIYSVSRTITDNFTPFVIRLTITAIGFLLVTGLVYNAINGVLSINSNTSLADKLAAMG